jgi:hypothetical protein
VLSAKAIAIIGKIAHSIGSGALVKKKIVLQICIRGKLKCIDKTGREAVLMVLDGILSLCGG